MAEQLAETREPAAIAPLDLLQDAVRDYALASKARNTLRAYRADLADFTRWCVGHGLERLPATPETVSLYINAPAQASARASTIQRRLSALSQAHKLAGHEPSPTQAPLVRVACHTAVGARGSTEHKKRRLASGDASRRTPSSRSGSTRLW